MILLGVTVDLWALFFGGSSHLAALLNGNRAVFYSSVASIAATLLGFVLTAFSIVIAFASDGRFAFLKREGHLPSIYDSFFVAVASLGLTTIVSIGGLLIDNDRQPVVPVLCLCITCICWAVGELAMCLAIFRKLIQLAVSPSPKRSGDQA